MLNRTLNTTDIILNNDVMYISNGLHDYMLTNFFMAFTMGCVAGMLIGMNGFMIYEYIKNRID